MERSQGVYRAAYLERIDISLDAIVGTKRLESLEWLFDYDAGRVYVRAR
ncbi:MAG: hypothetical protein IAI50_18560 [Candidatus Eremiobacteraeota bacterium]|nr:hypothetical protein [Candidatus Eremiobacteraeota bacterium]